jgi:hypothetical protein
MVAQLGGVGVFVPGDRALRGRGVQLGRFASDGHVQPMSLGTARRSTIFLVMEVSSSPG